MVAPAEITPALWAKVLEAGAPFGLKPAGLGARDTLRTEVCYPLYGHELDENTTPVEAGLGVFVALAKGDFMGRSVLAEQKARGTTKKLVAFKSAEKSAPPRAPLSHLERRAGPAAASARSPAARKVPSLGDWHRPGLCSAGNVRRQQPHRHRNPRQTRPGHHRRPSPFTAGAEEPFSVPLHPSQLSI